ncbi:MAG: phosphate ABC transporter substrate-binding protein PstS [Acidimicrobiales bacterium]
MTFTTARRTRMAATSLVALGLIASACGGSSKTSSPGSSATTGVPPTASVPGGTLNGSGSTFQKPFDDDAIQAFTKLHSGVTINYSGGGSGKGQSDLANHLVDFAGTDSLVKDLSKYPGGILYFPTVVGPITLSYNLTGVKKLTLTPVEIAKIFDGTIKNWNDAALAPDNPGLPNQPIIPVHRADGSGTTSNFTKYLTKADPTDWTVGSGTTVNWPGGQAGTGNPGVANIIKSTSGAIGYVDFSDATASGLSLASVKNASGNVVTPSLASASAAAAGATVNADLTYDPTNSPAPDAYPITSPTWIIVYKTQSDPTKAAILKGFLGYLLGVAQGDIAKQDNFAPLPASLQKQAVDQLSQLG